MTEFSSLKIVGGLLSSDLLGRIFAGDSQVPGTSPESYGLERGESVRRQASRSWPYLLETWQDEKKRDRWARILLRELGFPQQMPSHIAFRTLGWDVDLDHRTPHREARAPQSVMQEQLNRDDSRLWGILCNGVTLRLLRDSATLVGSSYVEFDLKAIFDGELFSDFVLLYLACHESRFAVQGDGGPESCYLEQWRAFAAAQGERALDQLRKGVTQAIAILGTGFISHPSNPQLRLSPRQRRAAPGRPQPRAAPPGVPGPLLVRRGRPRCAADPPTFPRKRLTQLRRTFPRKRGRVSARPATATTSSSPLPGSATWPVGSAAPATPTSSRRSS